MKQTIKELEFRKTLYAVVSLVSIIISTAFFGICVQNLIIDGVLKPYLIVYVVGCTFFLGASVHFSIRSEDMYNLLIRVREE